MDSFRHTLIKAAVGGGWVASSPPFLPQEGSQQLQLTKEPVGPPVHQKSQG